MAQKRMFSLQIVDTDAFLDMPLSTQALYFHLVMRADDEGFVSNPKKIMRLIGSQDDDFKILILKRFVLTFDNGIIVIKHWLIHNVIRMDRFNKTVYEDERKSLKIKSNKAYTENVIPNGTQRLPQVKLSKVKLSKVKTSLSDKSDEEDLRLSRLLYNRILDNNPNNRKPNIKSWAKEISLMRRIDKRTIKQIEYVINWCQQDNFWQSNILSTKKLREKFDQLVLKIKSNLNGNGIPVI